MKRKFPGFKRNRSPFFMNSSFGEKLFKGLKFDTDTKLKKGWAYYNGFTPNPSFNRSYVAFRTISLEYQKGPV